MSAQVRSDPAHSPSKARSAAVGEAVAEPEGVAAPAVPAVDPDPAGVAAHGVGVPGVLLRRGQLGIGRRIAEGGIQPVGHPVQEPPSTSRVFASEN